jgi:lipoprotein-anchoring transpeptidase ErfK/SrfK
VHALILCCLLASLACGEGLVDRAALDPAEAVPLLLSASGDLARNPTDAARIDAVDALARRIFLNGWRVPGRDQAGISIREVASGQTLSRIGKSAGVPADLLFRLNPGLDPRRLAIGTKVAVLDALAVPLRIDVRLSVHRLMVWRGPVLIMACPIGIGAGGTPTPTGSTTIAVRAKNPEWRDPVTRKVHPPGSPGNLLGGYWMGFDPGPDKRYASIGCHGWTGADPEKWLGQSGSRGCLRLTQTDIKDLYELILPGTVVEIKP